MVDVSIEDIERQIDAYEADPTDFMRSLPELRSPREYWFVSPYREISEAYPTKPLVAAALGVGDVNGGFSKPSSACNVLIRAGYVITDSAAIPITNTGTTRSIEDAVNDLSNSLGSTETFAIVKRRVGQNLFRLALMQQGKGKCLLTGISDPALLRASHIKAWSACENDAERLNPANGFLLSALWDAAFDAGRISFTDDGDLLLSPMLSEEAKDALRIDQIKDQWFQDHHAPFLQWHRRHHGFE